MTWKELKDLIDSHLEREALDDDTEVFIGNVNLDLPDTEDVIITTRIIGGDHYLLVNVID